MTRSAAQPRQPSLCSTALPPLRVPRGARAPERGFGAVQRDESGAAQFAFAEPRGEQLRGARGLHDDGLDVAAQRGLDGLLQARIHAQAIGHQAVDFIAPGSTRSAGW